MYARSCSRSVVHQSPKRMSRSSRSVSARARVGFPSTSSSSLARCTYIGLTRGSSSEGKRRGEMLWRLPLSTGLYLLTLLQSTTPANAGPFYSSQRKQELRELTRETWKHAYGSYKRLAFPSDEVLPLSCRAQGHDHAHPDNGAVNDLMGDFALTLVDSLDSFAVS